MDQNSIEAVVATCFPNTFMPKFRELYFIFHKHTGSASADDRSKLPALAFRKFIYSHFIDETEYQEFLKNNPLSQFTQVVGNLVGYSDGCTAEEAKDDKAFSAHKLVLELALRESFLKDRKSDLLLNVFGEENHKNLFGQWSHGEQRVSSVSEYDKGMSFCFHQSEQSLLRYVLDSDGSKDFHNEFTSLLINFTKNFLLEKFEDFRASLVLIAEDKKIALPNVAIADSLPAFEDFIKDETKGTSSPTSKDAGKVDNIAKELEVGIKENAEIYLDVVSSRYICKYCRGSFYFCQHKILARLQEILTQKGVCVNLRERNFGAIHKHITTHFKLTNSQSNVRIKFLGGISLKILATGRVAIEDKLSGRMEKSK